MVSNTMLTLAIGLLVGFSSPGRCQDLVDQVNKPPITCLGRITDCATCPSDALCTDISVGRLPGQPQTNDWYVEKDWGERKHTSPLYQACSLKSLISMKDHRCVRMSLPGWAPSVHSHRLGRGRGGHRRCKGNHPGCHDGRGCGE